MIRDLRRLLVASTVLFALGNASVGAQTIASSFEELLLKVKPGDTVYVTDDTGRERKAQILDLSSSSLMLSVDGTRQDLSQNNLKRMRQRLPDPVWNGALIGGGVGLAHSLVLKL